jgi:MinD superfamily P-loop ATPase
LGSRSTSRYPFPCTLPSVVVWRRNQHCASCHGCTMCFIICNAHWVEVSSAELCLRGERFSRHQARCITT